MSLSDTPSQPSGFDAATIVPTRNGERYS